LFAGHPRLFRDAGLGVALAGGVLVCGLVAGCGTVSPSKASPPAASSVSVPVRDWSITSMQGRVIDLRVEHVGGCYTAQGVAAESPRVVRLRVIELRTEGEACPAHVGPQDIQIVLQQPVGDRQVFQDNG
jgi:hypothetical protein